MDVRNYQKFFPSPNQNQQQEQPGFQTMNFYPPSTSQFHHQQFQQQQFLQQKQFQQYRQSMMNSMFCNSISPMSGAMNFGYNNSNNQFMGNGNHHQPQQRRQQQQFQGRNNFQRQMSSAVNLPPTPTFDLASVMPPPTLQTSENGNGKNETPREIFFRTLSASLKEANKIYSGKQTTWKNPFLYKTHLCENYCNRSYCRFGVNCWYAHGPHELRCIPESSELPDQNFITQYLSFLGLPKQTLEQIIQYAYYVTNLLTSPEGKIAFKNSSELPSNDSTRSCSTSHSPINIDEPAEDTFIASGPFYHSTATSNKAQFLSSLASNGGWAEIQSAINEIAENSTENFEEKSDFAKSFRLFGSSFNPRNSL